MLPSLSKDCQEEVLAFSIAKDWQRISFTNLSNYWFLTFGRWFRHYIPRQTLDSDFHVQTLLYLFELWIYHFDRRFAPFR